MAERRMFSKRIINSAKFLRMPSSSRLLYYDLGMEADDDGVVEAFSVMRKTGACEDDLRVLASKGFITVLNEDLVSFINDWTENNKIRADRKIDSVYKDLVIKLIPNAELLESKERADTGKKTGKYWTSNGQPTDNQWTAQDSIGKDSIGKDSIGKDSIGKDSIGKEQNSARVPLEFRQSSAYIDIEKDKEIEKDIDDISNKKASINADPKNLSQDSTPRNYDINSSNHSFQERIDYSFFQDKWNSICTSLPKCTAISDKRRKAIKACLNQFSQEEVVQAMKKTEESDFLSGRNGTWNGCNFDWFFNTNNMLKVIEGNYVNKDRKKNGGNVHGEFYDERFFI